MALYRISNNAGAVNPFFSTPLHALREERHIALVGFCFSNRRLARNPFQVRSLDPTHASLRSTTVIMITTSDSSVRRSGTPNQLRDVLLHTIAISGLSHVRTEFHNLLVIPPLAHHPKQTNRQPSGHGDLGNLSPTPHRQVDVLTTPFRNRAGCRLRRFY